MFFILVYTKQWNTEGLQLNYGNLGL